MINNTVFYSYVSDIMDHPRFQLLKKLPHHGKDNSVYDHSVATALFAFDVALFFHLSEEDIRSVTRAALLHDFFCYDWHGEPFRKFGRRYHGLQRLLHMHGFIHGHLAAVRAARFFELSPKQREAIAGHMFPLCLPFPKHKEAWIVTFADKVVASREVSQTFREHCHKFLTKPS